MLSSAISLFFRWHNYKLSIYLFYNKQKFGNNQLSGKSLSISWPANPKSVRTPSRIYLVVVCVLTLKKIWIKLSSVNYLYFKPFRVLSIIKVNAVRWRHLEFLSLLLVCVCVWGISFHCSFPLFIPKDVCSNQINVNPNARPL